MVVPWNSLFYTSEMGSKMLNHVFFRIQPQESGQFTMEEMLDKLPPEAPEALFKLCLYLYNLYYIYINH